MATRVIYEDYNNPSGIYLQVSSGTASSAFSTGWNTLTTTVDGAAASYAGVVYSTNIYTVSQSFSQFYTSGVSGVSSCTLSVYLTTVSATTTALEARIWDWGGTLSTSDGVRATTTTGLTILSDLTLVGSKAGSSLTTSAYNSIETSNLTPNINNAGFTRLIWVSSKQTTNDQSASSSYFIFTQSYTGISTNAPKITLVDSSTQSSQTLSGGATSFSPSVTGVHDLDMWGAGGQAASSSSQKAGSGGGAYSFAQYAVNSLASISVNVPNTTTTDNTQGGKCWFNSSSQPDPYADGGYPAVTAGSAGLGAYKYAGGAGASAQGGGGSRGGSGGGGSAGSTSSGLDGSSGSSSTGGAGGNSGTPSSALGGGVGLNAALTQGQSLTYGGGGGKGGAGGGGQGGTGGVPGGGGGGGGSSSGANGNGGAGKMIVYWYVYPASSARRRVILTY